MREFPRILIVAPQTFNHLTGSGVTFTNLFATWPKDRIAAAHSDIVPPSTDVCERYFRIGRDEIDLFAPLRLVRNFRDRRQAEGAKAVGSAVAAAPASRTGVIARIQGDSAPQQVRLSEAVMRWIAEFRPELLYSVLGSNAFMALTASIRRKFAVPMVVHMMDDFPAINYRRGVFAAMSVTG